MRPVYAFKKGGEKGEAKMTMKTGIKLNNNVNL